MLRGLLVMACVLVLSGCASPAPTADPVEPDTAPPAATTEQVRFEGQYDAVVVNGEQMESRGGVHTLDVAGSGWRNVLVRLDIHIETVLLLLPPGCSPDDACALRLQAPAGQTDVMATVPSMEAGAWTTAMELQDGNQVPARVAGSVYELTFDYVVA